jgi:hypothetical protein
MHAYTSTCGTRAPPALPAHPVVQMAATHFSSAVNDAGDARSNAAGDAKRLAAHFEVSSRGNQFKRYAFSTLTFLVSCPARLSLPQESWPLLIQERQVTLCPSGKHLDNAIKFSEIRYKLNRFNSRKEFIKRQGKKRLLF